MRPVLFSIAMFPSVQIKDNNRLQRLLDLFENFDICLPTHWSNSESTSLGYDRNTILEKALLTEHSISELYLYGKHSSISYSARFSLNLSFRSFLEIDFKTLPQKHWGDFFEFSDQIAEIVKPRYGATHLFWPTSIPWHTECERLQCWMDFCAQPAPVNLGVMGPLGLAARTYFGSDILELLDNEVVAKADMEIKRTEWEGLCIDVIRNPWSVDAEKLLDAWMSAMGSFNDVKLFAIPQFHYDSRRSVSFQPNEKWTFHLNRLKL